MIDVEKELQTKLKELFTILKKGGLNPLLYKFNSIHVNRKVITPVVHYDSFDSKIRKSFTVKVLTENVVELGFYDPQLVQKIKKLTA